MNKISGRHLSCCGKDISNPGCIGNALECFLKMSGKRRSEWDIENIPIPEGIELIQWLKAYQGCGFVLTCPTTNSKEIIELFNSVKVAAAVVGKVDGSRRLTLQCGDEDLLCSILHPSS